MVLIIGAESSGKLDYVKSLGFSDEEISDGIIDSRPVVYHLEKITASEPGKAGDLLPLLLTKKAVVCCEVGSGVIPATPEERAVREETGRLCVSLAGEADSVIRLVCGIPTILK